MLAAILNGKRRGSGIEGKHSHLGDATGAEDILTATIFERLIYLPESVRDSFFAQPQSTALFWMCVRPIAYWRIINSGFLSYWALYVRSWAPITTIRYREIVCPGAWMG
ncbi:hypothetical protein METHP14_10354 [Pseudomonas sp. P14-2025]